MRHDYSPAEAANVANTRHMAGQGDFGGDPVLGHPDGAGLMDRLSALEARVAALESSRGRVTAIDRELRTDA